MSIALRTAGVHHIALRVTDLERSKRFYVDTLGFPVVAEFPGLVLFSAGNAVVGIRGAGETTPTGDAFDPFRVGLDHIALVCEDEGIWSTGAKTDEALGKRYVAFKDPDGIKWEYFMA